MARTVQHDKGTIHAQADEDEDDVTVAFDKIKTVTAKAVLLRVDGDDVWIPFSQLVDVFPSRKEAIVTEWIAKEKGLS